MGFQKFIKQTRVVAPKVSVWSKGQIGLNKALIDALDLKTNKYVELYYDPETRRVAFDFTAEKKDNSMTVGISQSGSGIISAKTFLDNFEILPEQTMAFELFNDPDSGMKVIYLDQGVVSGRAKKEDTEETLVEGSAPVTPPPVTVTQTVN